MKKLFISCTLSLMAMFAFTTNASADTTVKDSNEEVEVTISEEQTSKASTEEVDEFTVYQRVDGSIVVVHSHTVTLALNK